MRIQIVVLRAFLKLVRCYPLVFPALMIFAVAVLIALWPQVHGRGEQAILLLGFVFYSSLLAMFIVKLYGGTWQSSCESFEWMISPDGMFSPTYRARLRSAPCPACGEPLSNRPFGHRAWKHRMSGGWACPDCGHDVDPRQLLRRK